MELKYSLLFYPKKEKGYKSGPIMIYARITVLDCPPAEFSTGQKVDPEKWDEGRLTGRTEDIKSLKRYLETLTSKVRDCHGALLESCDYISAEMLRNKVVGRNQKPNKLIEIFKQHNKDMAELVKKDEVASGTLVKYFHTLKHLTEYMTWKFKISEIDIRKVDHEFVTQFEFYLKTVKNCNDQTSVKYVKNFAKIINICLDNNWITINPFAKYKPKVKKKKPVPLTEYEVGRLIGKEFSSKRLEQIRDIFIFCCFTGLAYSDVKKLSASNLFIGIDKKLWIDIDRTKTEEDSKVPLLPIAEGLVRKYKEDPYCVSYNKVFPVISNQKMNEYLHEIATLCEINKKMTSHIARHTFATTITLANKVPLETVSKMLGHADISSTQIYAQVLENKISRDMNDLELKSSLAHLTPQLSAVS